MAAWGWRVPFVGSIIFCIVGWFLRRGMHETAEGLKAIAIRPPLIPIPHRGLATDGADVRHRRHYKRSILSDLHLHGGTTQESCWRRLRFFCLRTRVSLILVLIAKPFGGWLSDRIGRRRLMLFLTCATMGLVYPAFGLMLYGTPLQFMFGQILLAVPSGWLSDSRARWSSKSSRSVLGSHR